MLKRFTVPLLAFLFMLVLSACGKSSPSQAQLIGMDYIDGVFNNNMEQVLKTINTKDVDEQQLKQVKEQLQNALDIVAQEVQKQGGLKNFVVQDIKETSKEALITIVVNFNNNTSQETMIALAKYEDQWYVVSM